MMYTALVSVYLGVGLYGSQFFVCGFPYNGQGLG